MRAAAIAMPAMAPIAVAIPRKVNCSQKSRHDAIGRRMARRAAITPITTQNATLSAIATGYELSSAIGAPTTSRPGAAITTVRSPSTALRRPEPSRKMISATRPKMSGALNPTNGPPRRMRVRYQRGPPTTAVVIDVSASMTGASDRMAQDYGAALGIDRHGASADPTDPVVVCVAASGWLAAVVSSRLIPLVAGAALVVVMGLCRRSGASIGAWALAVITVSSAVGVHAALQRSGSEPTLGGYVGWVTVVDDPQPSGGATRVLLDIEGDRYEMWARGRGARRRVGEWDAGNQVYASGERAALSPTRRDRVAWQHVVGVFDAEWLGDRIAGSPLARASNRIRYLVASASERLPEPDDTLFTGLVIGDDRTQPPEMLARFRRTGLSHLTAVSGQNVALVLAAASPLLRRLTGRARVGVTLILIAWFVVITRLEPSIIRAGVMAALAVIARATGRQGSPVRLLALAVCVLLIIDPLLAQSVGFQLSVGATAGVALLASWLGERLSALGPLALPVGVTLGAQIGVLVPSALVFGRLPLVGLAANVLAVPIAGLVMLLGLPIAIIGAPTPPLLDVLMLPMRLGVRWVDTIAVLADRLEPDRAAVGWWAHGCAAVLSLWWFAVRRTRVRLIDTHRHGNVSAQRR